MRLKLNGATNAQLPNLKSETSKVKSADHPAIDHTWRWAPASAWASRWPPPTSSGDASSLWPDVSPARYAASPCIFPRASPGRTSSTRPSQTAAPAPPFLTLPSDFDRSTMMPNTWPISAQAWLLTASADDLPRKSRPAPLPRDFNILLVGQPRPASPVASASGHHQWDPWCPVHRLTAAAISLRWIWAWQKRSVPNAGPATRRPRKDIREGISASPVGLNTIRPR